MLNPFPIQFLAPLAYFFLRITLALVCIRLGRRILGNADASGARRALGGVLIGTGSLLLIGLYAQIAALIVMGLSLLGIMRSRTLPEHSRTTLALMGAIAASLFITGGGPFGFDLPI